MYKDNEDYGLKNDNDIYSNSKRDISSHSKSYDDFDMIDITPKRQYYDLDEIRNSRQTEQRKPPPKKKKRKKHLFLKFVTVLLCICIVAGLGLYGYAYNLLNKIERTPLDTANLGIASADFEGYKNIALLGLDTREDNKTGRSDANVILTVDKKHKKIKLTSIARDSYVAIDGHSYDKLTHAYAYGKSQLSVKTLNQNFGLEITDYVTMNFFELAHIIDYIGGIEIELDEREVKELNRVVLETDFGGMEKPMAKTAGLQRLSGTQAVCFARIRKIDGDVERGNRQKEVLSAMFREIKKMNPLKLPELASLMIAECETSLSTNDIISMGVWAITASPEFDQLSIPNDNVKGQGKTIKGTWYYYYDIEEAKNEIKDFIFEENYYSPEEIAERESHEKH